MLDYGKENFRLCNEDVNLVKAAPATQYQKGAGKPGRKIPVGKIKVLYISTLLIS